MSAATASGCFCARCPHQRGLFVRGFLRIRVGAAGQEGLDCRSIASSCARHQHRFAAHQRRVGIGASLQQPLDHWCAAVEAREVERRRPRVVRRIDACARTDQQRCHRCIVVERSPMECRCAVPLPGVDVHLLQQRPRRFDVSGLDCVEQARIACSMSERGCSDARAHGADEDLHFTWGSAPHPGSVACGAPLCPAPLPRGRAVRAAVMRPWEQNSRKAPHDGLDTSQQAIIESTGAIADAIHLHAELVEQRQMKVRERRFLRVSDVTPALQMS